MFFIIKDIFLEVDQYVCVTLVIICLLNLGKNRENPSPKAKVAFPKRPMVSSDEGQMNRAAKWGSQEVEVNAQVTASRSHKTHLHISLPLIYYICWLPFHVFFVFWLFDDQYLDYSPIAIAWSSCLGSIGNICVPVVVLIVTFK